MYNGSITFPVDKSPSPIMPFISISIISSPFVPTNHSNPFSFYLQLYHESNPMSNPDFSNSAGARAARRSRRWSNQMHDGIDRSYRSCSSCSSVQPANTIAASFSGNSSNNTRKCPIFFLFLFLVLI